MPLISIEKLYSNLLKAKGNCPASRTVQLCVHKSLRYMLGID